MESIVKVYSGNDNLLLSLQRDFAIYVVNIFSLQQASRVLSYENHSVKSLLWKFCKCDYLLLGNGCDWRVRPLSDELIRDVLREVHCMPYLFDVLRNELLNRSPKNLNLVCVNE